MGLAFDAELDILRLTTLGQTRNLRVGLALRMISPITRQVRMASWSGGKSRRGGHLAADDPQRVQKRHPVRVQIGLVRGVFHQLA